MQKSLLIDLDGVLRIGSQPAEDISQFLKFLEDNSIPACILSNSSLNYSKQIYDFFQSYSINLNIPIITSIDAAYIYIKDKYKRVAVFTSENVIELFSEFLDYENPEAVLVGDIGDKWNYKLMQTIFEYIQNGAELIAAHKNKFWEKSNLGIQLDAGPFIHGIEYATDKNATLIGKPSELYFQSALEKINKPKNSNFIMLGDDLDSDMRGAKNLGAETILILTGKTKLPIPDDYKNSVDYITKNLSEVTEVLKIKF